MNLVASTSEGTLLMMLHSIDISLKLSKPRRRKLFFAWRDNAHVVQRIPFFYFGLYQSLLREERGARRSRRRAPARARRYALSATQRRSGAPPGAVYGRGGDAGVPRSAIIAV